MKSTTLVLYLALLLVPRWASADCLPRADAASFQAALLARLKASPLSVDQLEHHAQNRLGVGAPNPAATGSSDDERRAALAARIAASLAAANARPGQVEQALAEIQVTRSDPQVPSAIYRHASTTMSEAYSELESIRRQVFAAPTLAQKTELARRRIRIAADVRAAAATRELAILELAAPIDVGAVLGEFWNNHFNISATKVPYAVVDYQRALRIGTCGSFKDLLFQSAKHPGMLAYLDNAKSTAGAINENYGREVMELHTLGDDTLEFYTHDDVRGVARALTGWSVAFSQTASSAWHPEFRFYPSAHDPSALDLFEDAPRGLPLHLDAAPKSPKGVPLPEAVVRGERVLSYLAQHPATRRNICRKLAVRLVGFSTPTLLQACIAAWGTDGDLPAVYRTILQSGELWSASPPPGTRAYGVKFKNPLELVASTSRAVRTPRARLLTVEHLNAALAAIAGLGIPVSQVAPPTGYADDGRWRAPGSLLRFNPYLFSQLDISGLSMNTPQGPRGGPGLERYVQDRVLAAITSPDADAALSALGRELVTDLLRLPADHTPSSASIKAALAFPDQNIATGATSRVRSFSAAVLGSPAFLRK